MWSEVQLNRTLDVEGGTGEAIINDHVGGGVVFHVIEFTTCRQDDPSIALNSVAWLRSYLNSCIAVCVCGGGS